MQNGKSFIRNEQVIGSNPTISSSEIKASEIIGSFFVVIFIILSLIVIFFEKIACILYRQNNLKTKTD